MKTLIRLLLICILTAFTGIVELTDAAPYKGNRFPSDEQIQKSLNLKDACQPIGMHSEGLGNYKYFILKKMPSGQEAITALQVIQLDNGFWLISDGAGGYVLISQ